MFLPELGQLIKDLGQIRRLGANAVRVYHVPSPEVLDAVQAAGLRLMVDVPWQKHRCFFEDWEAPREAMRLVRTAARDIGRHSGCFAISVANEIPHDIVRFYGHQRVARFLDDLLAVAKDEAPDCLVTYCNYPSTEFLEPRRMDFYCANVYLHDRETLGRYLDRLHHVAGPLPVLLGEHGMDSLRNGEARQAEDLACHVRTAYRRGLAGTFVFSYTDDWFTGGAAIENWAFGITDSGRREKPAAKTLRKAWADNDNGGSDEEFPRVSVVVCSYNGAATLKECLTSLVALDYPDYEVILVDDGSTDSTREIVGKFPAVRYQRQPNRGLSAARNAGAAAASGAVVAYTDSDCMADPAWLRNLMLAMIDQGVEAIGGPNIPPASDGLVAKCVAASPGGPSHVMLDDRLAEHVPGCNMAFQRNRLLALGGFDEQFRQAGDDVDICWRFIDEGLPIGYAPGALVWHHRRATVRAYLRQQAGYGRSEAMVLYKHPKRAAAFGGSLWRGVIYGDSAVGLPVASDAVYHGRFGTGTFQIIYRTTRYTPWVYATLLEWHAATALVASLAVAWTPAVAIACIMLCLSLIAAGSAAASALLPRGASWWCRPLVFMLNLVQPAVRSWHRYAYRLFGHRAAGRRISTESTASMTAAPIAGPTLAKRVSWRAFDQYWISRNGRGREQLLDILTESAKSDGWRGDYEAEWAAHDVELWPSPWHVVHISTATEELGQERRFTRARASLHTTLMTKLALALGVLWLTIGLAAWHVWGGIPGVLLLGVLGICVVRDRTIQRRAVRELIAAAGRRAGLQPVNPYPPRLTTEHQLPVTKDRKCGHAANDELLEELAPTT